MTIDFKKIIDFLVKRSIFLMIMGFLLVVTLFEFTYWKYFYLPKHSFEEPVIESKIEMEKLKKLIEDITKKEEYYLQNINKEYKDPFQ